VQDARDSVAAIVLFTNYDFAGRPLVTGRDPATFVPLDPNAPPTTLETATSSWRLVRAYDAKPSTVGFPWSLFSTQINALTLNGVAGRLAAEASLSNGAWQVSLYSYDTDGRVAQRYVYTQANSGTAVLTAVNTTIEYTRNLADGLTRRLVTVGASSWYQWYDYDARGKLWKLSAGTTPTKPTTADVTYLYRPSGQVESRQFASMAAVPFKYTIREQLDSLGNVNATTLPFAARYTYHANGMIAESEFYNAHSTATEKRYRYQFPTASYDPINRLLSADYSGRSGTSWTVTDAHDLRGITYDRSGNITALQRFRNANTLIDNLTYGVAATSNRLNTVTDAVATTAETWDAEGGAFSYDVNGNLLTAPAPYGMTAVTYDHFNLPISLTTNGTTTAYRNDHQGRRITKQVGTGNTEFYLLDGEEHLGVFTINSSGAVASSFFNLLVEGKAVGRQPNTGNRLFYHTDLLGSTRVVVSGTTTVTLVEGYDYDPYGLLMPGRSVAGGTKPRFTGKESDTESGLTYFGARYYLAALGQWSSPDPMMEATPEWSSYHYVLGNPVLYTDPFGLTRCPPDCPTFTAAQQQAVFQAMGQIAPELNRELVTFLPKNVAMAVGGNLVGAAVTRVAAGVAGARSGTTTLYRVVKAEELAGIEASSGGFSNVAASAGGKYFATTAAGAAQYAKMASKGFGEGPFTLVSTRISTKALQAAKDIGATVDRGIASVRLPEGLLRTLSPAQVHTSMPIP
jgi:RHS repeat-associated protein